MRLVEHAGADALVARAGSFLTAEDAEAENNLVLGILHTLRTAPEQFPGGAWLASVEDGGAVVGVAAQTPPHSVLVTRMPLAAAELVARARPEATGVIGPTEVAERVALLSGRAARVHRRERIYACARVVPPQPASGRARLATVDDAIVVAWRRAFSADVGDPPPADEAMARFQAWVAAGDVWLWDDGDPVAMGAAVGRTPTGIRISAVYTPAARRRRGYATSLVAAMTEAQLGAGRRACFLYTDLANPTSNGIYQRIGYRPVCDVTSYLLGEGPT